MRVSLHGFCISHERTQKMCIPSLARIHEVDIRNGIVNVNPHHGHCTTVRLTLRQAWTAERHRQSVDVQFFVGSWEQWQQDLTPPIPQIQPSTHQGTTSAPPLGGNWSFVTWTKLRLSTWRKPLPPGRGYPTVTIGTSKMHSKNAQSMLLSGGGSSILDQDSLSWASDIGT